MMAGVDQGVAGMLMIGWHARAPLSAGALIEQTAQGVVRARLGVGGGGFTPWQVAGPHRLRVRCQTPAHADIFALWPGVEREDSETVAVPCGSVHEAVRCLNAMSAMASSVPR